MGDDGRNALEWLTSRDFYAVEAAFNNMEVNNEERKDEQLECQRQALAQAKKQVELGYFLCVCYVPDFTHGVVGLAASHVMQETGLPAIVLSKKDSGDITGSARSIPGFDLRGAIEEAQNECGVLTKFGGHTMAAGMSMRSDMDIPVFRETINDIAQRVFKGQQPEPVFYHDGDLPSSLLNVDSLQSLLALGPFGQEFPAPSFFIEGRVKSVKFMGKDKAHAKLALSSGQEIVWFRHEGKANGIEGKTAKSVVSLSINEFRGNKSVQLLNQAIQFES
jgi:single-stranded-DNA-specific exonuclease